MHQYGTRATGNKEGAGRMCPKDSSIKDHGTAIEAFGPLAQSPGVTGALWVSWPESGRVPKAEVLYSDF